MNGAQHGRIVNFIWGMNAVLKDDTELFKLFSDNEWFRRWLLDTVFSVTDAERAGERQAEASRR